MYATIANLEERLHRELLEQATGTTEGSAEYTAALTEALTRAGAEIDSYVAARFAVPLQPSERIEELTCDIAAYKLERKNNVVRESERQAYEDAIAFLKLVAAGRATLDQPAGEEAQSGEADVLETDQTRIFSDTNLDGY